MNIAPSHCRLRVEEFLNHTCKECSRKKVLEIDGAHFDPRMLLLLSGLLCLIYKMGTIMLTGENFLRSRWNHTELAGLSVYRAGTQERSTGSKRKKTFYCK